MMTAVTSANKPSRRFARELLRGIDSRLEGKPGGAASMNLFSTKNHATSTYVRNTGMWLHDLRHQLSCAVAMKTGGIGEPFEDLGGVLITPRHILYCSHSYPDAYNPGPRGIRFVLGDNTVVATTQISQAPIAGAVTGAANDLCVATLNADVQALGVHVVPIWSGPSASPFTPVAENWFVEFPMFAISQGFTAGSTPPTPVSDYPQEHDVMCYVNNHKGSFSGSPRNLFDYAVYTNDSGTPKFIIYKDIIYLVGILVTSFRGAADPPGQIAAINAAITASDDLAIAAGRLGSRTNLTVSLPADPTL